jgi:hypothetical protein
MKDANIIINDLSLFEGSCRAQGLSATVLDTPREFMNRYTRSGVMAKVVIHDPNAVAENCGAHNAAFLCAQATPHGGYSFATDTYRNDIGQRAQKALYDYAANVIEQNALAQGMQVVDREVNAKGEVELVMARL